MRHTMWVAVRLEAIDKNFSNGLRLETRALDMPVPSRHPLNRFSDCHLFTQPCKGRYIFERTALGGQGLRVPSCSLGDVVIDTLRLWQHFLSLVTELTMTDFSGNGVLPSSPSQGRMVFSELLLGTGYETLAFPWVCLASASRSEEK